jgi:hypothetical protein
MQHDRLSILLDAIRNFRIDRPVIAAHDASSHAIFSLLIEEIEELRAVEDGKHTASIPETSKDIA